MVYLGIDRYYAASAPLPPRPRAGTTTRLTASMVGWPPAPGSSSPLRPDTSVQYLLGAPDTERASLPLATRRAERSNARLPLFCWPGDGHALADRAVAHG